MTAARTFFALAVFLLALGPRVVGLDTFVTTDEIFWAGRTGNFSRALLGGRLNSTFQTGHPGVTTLWLGLLGMGPERAQRLAGERREVSRSQVSRSPDFLPGLSTARRAVAVVTALAVAAIALLAWRLLGPGPALAGGALVALDPFFLAHSQLLHIDALLTSFVTLALLAGLVRWLAHGGRGYLWLSAAATGLALLSKSPALFLFGFIPLGALVSSWVRQRRLSRTLCLELLTWAGAALLTYVVCWPALWAAPFETLRGVLAFVADNANARHAAATEGSQFGPLFYPTAFGLRTTPLVLVGLALLAIEGVWLVQRRVRGDSWPPIAGALFLYALLFGAAMTFAAKSFDRYLLPVFPSLDLLAGIGLALGARRLGWAGGAGRLLAAAFGLPLLVYPVASTLPYALAWYNPLFGGGAAAQRVLPVGWGEGLDQVARYLNAKPNADRLRVALPGEIYTTVLDAQFVGQVTPAEAGDPTAFDAAYFVTYIRAPQDPTTPLYDSRFEVWQPEFTVRLANVEYARVYSTSVGVPLGATFGDVASLEGYGVDAVATRPGRALNVKLFWRSLGSAPVGAQVVLILTNPAGLDQARAELPLGPLQPGQTRPRSFQLNLPASLQPADYLLWVSLEGSPGQPLPLAGRPSALSPGAPEAPSRAVLRGIQVR